jgi:hypothetical protein
MCIGTPAVGLFVMLRFLGDFTGGRDIIRHGAHTQSIIIVAMIRTDNSHTGTGFTNLNSIKLKIVPLDLTKEHRAQRRADQDGNHRSHNCISRQRAQLD